MLEIVIFSTLNGILYGLLLFMLSSGLTLIFSMMGVLNFAHASFYMLGAYFAYTLGMHTGFWPALILAPLLVGALGALVERFGLRRVHANGHVAELLFTFGLAYVIDELVQMMWGTVAVAYREPAYMREPLFTLFGTDYSIFRGVVILISILMFVALWYLLKKTRVGLMIRAALTHGEMVGHLGHNVPRLFMGVFGFGCALAGLAGVIGGPIMSTEPGMAATLGPIVFVVVVVGGMGSLQGAFYASLLIGLIQTFFVAVNASVADVVNAMGANLDPYGELGRISLATLAPMTPFILLVLILIFRPRGLMGELEP
ncbi:branched-chain amino acid ABC transporter permease [Alloalcanivorax profundimaris]|uniref:branched-chain amino acid ABC transporter permease n=1 Tax=Alloalcanivorax profundimaris TaxID=2735259 RepID=UPI000C63F347|nr:branched-chain amino acid ABC transporter permease [Alloalcanivorax profundimaris]MAO59481.1 branched-chain amino acid ABC transporter permease [Alcanivorax sp.]MBM1142877.1 branched-chain amino acid ABC transporter permease [Alcanivorax sp. ZXX171]MCQ6263337.1 branched-chain amino acid ABC transporter permease [Alcanivorax sp. MM125-6]UWN51681.1 High-affinity branched-chain amino acid transport system permease protein LivH [Alcanivorax sp. ALC70]MAY09908.1 branched-chain amino acid ABC tra|tara:strand:- start:2805 stop:3746 length:942 start_codon:yes stop_codon:yes gene_type:complete